MKPGEIVLVRFPFASLTATKKRPALVISQVELSGSDRLVTVAMITSLESALKIQGDVVLKDWRGSGLLHESIVRLAKIATLDSELIQSTIGKLGAVDTKQVRRAFAALFSSWA